MKKRFLIIPLIPLLLVGCRKTEQAFEAGKYNSGNFDLNYYTEWDGIKNPTTGEYNIKIEESSMINVPSYIYLDNKKISNDGLPYDFEVKNLIKEEDQFSYGYLSKLYDGRLRCDNLTTRSRVQLNKTGYATFFPKEYRGSQSLAFALRGGTTIAYADKDERTAHSMITVKVSIKFYIRIEGTDKYNLVDFNFDNLPITSDNNGSTTYVEMPFGEQEVSKIYGADAMSFEFELKSPETQFAGYDITDDIRTDPDKTKKHFSIMLYEVLLPGSSWY